MDFTELGLSEKTIKAIKEVGINSPTTVQVDVIPSILAGKDVFTIAPSRCGKTYSYVLPLIDIIANRTAKNILVITAGSKQSVAVSDCFAVFNKYHEINENTVTENEDEINQEANVIIASPNLLIDLMNEEKIDLSQINILVVDDINLIKKMHQLDNLEKVLAVLPADKQNIVFTNRRSKETQSILDKILQTPEEIKVDRTKESEAEQKEENIVVEKEENESVIEEKTNKSEEYKTENTFINKPKRENIKDYEAISLMKRYRSFGRRTPDFMLVKAELAIDE